MDSGWAVVIGASVAFLGSLVGTVAAPWIARSHERRIRMEEGREAEMRRIILQIFRTAIAVRTGHATPDERVSALTQVVELDTWLKPDEWQIEFVMNKTLVVGSENPVTKHFDTALVSASDLVIRWLRGEMTAADVGTLWQKATGIEVEPPPSHADMRLRAWKGSRLRAAA